MDITPIDTNTFFNVTERTYFSSEPVKIIPPLNLPFLLMKQLTQRLRKLVKDILSGVASIQ